MKTLLIQFAFLIFLSNLSLAQEMNYKRVKIFATDKQFQELVNQGLSIDHGIRKSNKYIIAEISSEELNIIKSSNLKFDILIDDLVFYYQHQNDGIDIKSIKKSFISSIDCNNFNNYPVPQNFDLGTYAGFFRYQEMLDNLDSMASKYPNLIKARSPIDTMHTIQGRDVFWLKISDNPNASEPEPKILYDAIHHAREPTSMSEVIYYMWYLLENYATNPDIKYLVDNTEMFFIPCVNPDGYIHNETLTPNGGGMWRKNRRNNGNGTFGVDPNRNYGYMWVGTGSSANSNSDSYRGTAPFSEPENRMMKFMCETNNFTIAVNAHSFGNYLIHPWGHNTDSLPPDSNIFRRYSAEMVRENGYLTGTGLETVGYFTNGDSDDWMYGEQTTKPKIFSMTPEVGANVSPSGFWPPATQIIGMCQNATSMNLMGAKLITSFAQVKDKSPYNISSLSYYQKLSVERLGYDITASYAVSLTPLQNVTSIGSTLNYAQLNLFDLHLDSIQVNLSNSIQDGDVFSFVINTNNGIHTYRDTITKVFGIGGNIFFDNCNGITNWNSNSTWGNSSTIFYSAPSSITDSPIGNYPDEFSSEIITSQTINLQNATSATLNFWARWNLEIGFDYTQVSASADSGLTWKPLCGLYTKNGNALQDFNKPIYDGFQNTWVQEKMSLDEFIGQSILIKFKLASDQGTTYDGFYFDDLSVKVFGDSTVSVNEISQFYENVIYPNPAQNNVSIQLGTEKYNMITIMDAIGNNVLVKNIFNEKTVSFNVSNLSNGMYYIKLSGLNENTKTSKFIIRK